ncbi:MAG: MFS transporter [Deltaproteobacteria bacterium]|nr:MFS transporter [Deltaproteobacteria bacterium]
MNERDKKLIFIAVTTASFLATYTGSAVNVALHTIGEDLHLNHTQLQYVVTAYLMMNAVLLVPFGRLADIYGRRLLFHVGMVTFLVAHIICAFAPSGWVLIRGGGAGGIAASMFFSNTIAILSSVFPESERGKILGLNVSIAYIGITVGPFIGGVLTSYWGWRSVFLSVVPIVIAGIALSYWKLPKDFSADASRKFNLSGSAHYVVMLILLILGLSALPKTNGALAVGASVILGVFFFMRDSRSENPLVNIRLFRGNRIFVFANVANFIQYLSAYATAFLLSLFLQNGHIKNLDPHVAGFILLAQPLVQAVISPIAGALSDRLEPRWLASGGMTITAGALLAFAFISASTPFYTIVLILACLGVGFAFFTSPNNNSIMSSVSPDVYGTASGILSTGRILGMSLSLATTAIVFNIFDSRHDTPDAFLTSFHTIFVIFFLFSLGGIASSMIRGKVDARRDTHVHSRIGHAE